MRLKTFFFTIVLLVFGLQIMAQNEAIIRGVVMDADSKEPLPYTNIIVLHKNIGTISNEKGEFSMDISVLSPNDSISFQYIGYAVNKMLIAQLDTASMVYLKEELINLSEAFVFGNPPEPKDIVEKVLKNKEKNYKKRITQAQTFVRWRNISDIKKIDMDYKKNSIDEIDEDLLTEAANKIPKHNTSYTDFLLNLYLSDNDEDTLKIDPIRTVSLKIEEITELKQMAKVFEDLFTDTKEEEYWKVKSGILSQKLDIQNNDTIEKKEEKNTIGTSFYRNAMSSQLEYSYLSSKDDWDFLYHTGRYKYVLSGGTKINGEDVYIIDFEPKKSGLYQGRVYISIESYALIRADYQYAEGKIGDDFHLFGVGYSVNHFSGSIFFEKKNDSYHLKYFSHKKASDFSLDRNVSLIKKKERFLFDKKLKEIKIGIQTAMSMEESIEVLILNEKTITHKQFKDFEQKKRMKIIYTDFFDNELWKGYPSIEPIKRMKEYKKETL